jgi:hypothetical protein
MDRRKKLTIVDVDLAEKSSSHIGLLSHGLEPVGVDKHVDLDVLIRRGT